MWYTPLSLMGLDELHPSQTVELNVLTHSAPLSERGVTPSDSETECVTHLSDSEAECVTPLSDSGAECVYTPLRQWG